MLSASAFLSVIHQMSRIKESRNDNGTPGLHLIFDIVLLLNTHPTI